MRISSTSRTPACEKAAATGKQTPEDPDQGKTNHTFSSLVIYHERVKDKIAAPFVTHKSLGIKHRNNKSRRGNPCWHPQKATPKSTNKGWTERRNGN